MKRSLVPVFVAAIAGVCIAPAAASTCDKNFAVVNETANSITQLYVSPHASDSWEDDLLTTGSAIEPDTSWRVNMASDDRNLSLYDIKVILDDGSKVIGGRINLCRATKVYVYDDRITYE